jgi:hypothetical protein
VHSVTTPEIFQPGHAAADRIAPPERRWVHDPVGWALERAQVRELWSGQRRILESVRDNHDTAVISCHEIGKSFSAALTVAWWLDVHPAGDAFCLTSAPTGAQVKAILWREINRFHARAGLRGRVNLTEWYIGNELVALGRKPDEHNPTAMQGTHAKYFIVVLDEACGIPGQLWDAASTLTTNENSRTLAIGNPDIVASELANVCRTDSGWNVIQIGYRDTPNFTGESVSLDLRQRLISRRWVEQRRVKWGEKSALFQSKCEGRFPEQGSPMAVVPYDMATACRYLEYPESEPVEAGVDVGGGGDRTVVRERRGARAGRVERFLDPDPMNTVGRIALKLREWGVQRVKVDSTGIGWGIAGRLRELSSKHAVPGAETAHNAEVIAVNFAESPSLGTKHLYLNRRAELWWAIGREYSRLKRWDLSDVDDDVIHELTTPEYQLTGSGAQIKVQPKEEVIKKLGFSPDEAEALLLAFLDVTYESPPSTAVDQYVRANLLSGLTPH